MVNRKPPTSSAHAGFATRGWFGLGLIAVFWPLSWFLTGPRTFWCFFPLWLGYNLTVDALVLWRRGTSLFTRDWRKYVGLFLASMPTWWLFEVMNWRTQNWRYLGGHLVSGPTYVVVSSINFSIVVPAVFGSAELMASFGFVQRMGCGPVIRPDRRTTTIFFVAGLVMLALLMAWPLYFFPFVWLSVYFILEPINIWLGNRSLASWVGVGDWRPVVALWLGALTCGFFWEMWNFLSYPKWVYVVPWKDYLHVFEMPLLGYGGYLPFALELYAIYHLVVGLLGHKATDYVHVAPDNNRPVP